MTLSNRREFLRQTSLGAAAVCWPRTNVIRAVARVVEGRAQVVVPIDSASIHKLASQITGRVITPNMADYDSSRRVFNLAYDRHPAVMVRCAGASDVARALDFAQSHNLPLAIRAGGHSRLAYGMCDGGVVIDLSAMKRVDVDAGKRTARAQAGALVRDLDEATQRFGLATTSGGCPTVGIAGFTLGGGEGHLMPKYGAACDNLLSAQVVTVDGRLVEASQKSNPDLFWAIRGGGGNFAVATELEYQLHTIGPVLAGTLTYPAGGIAELVQAFARFIAVAPDEMDAFAQLLPCPQGRRVKIDIFYCGDPRIGNSLLGPLRALTPEEESIKVKSYLEAQAVSGFLVAPVAHFQTNLFLPELSHAAITAIATAVNRAPLTCKVIIVALRGAVSRVSVSDMAYALREPGFEIDIAGVWSTPAEKAGVVRWVNSTRDTLLPFANGVYVNQLGDTSDQLVRTAYGSNYARLVKIKKKYDPNNVLRLNQNIKPA